MSKDIFLTPFTVKVGSWEIRHLPGGRLEGFSQPALGGCSATFPSLPLPPSSHPPHPSKGISSKVPPSLRSPGQNKAASTWEEFQEVTPLHHLARTWLLC